nr:carbonic anhydrase [Fredinandcohnia onubensis]
MDQTRKKTLFITDMESGLEPILQEETNVQPENMLMIQSYGPLISHPFGEIMRSIILAIYQENVEEIFVVGTTNKHNNLDDAQRQLKLPAVNKIIMDDKIKTVDYLFKNVKPEFVEASVSDWLDGSGNDAECIKKSIEKIRQHPLVPPYVKIHSLVVNRNVEVASVNQR